jgi:redox-regulated HSP33 family molecular chaperone
MLKAVASLGAAEVKSIVEEQGHVEVRGCCA